MPSKDLFAKLESGGQIEEVDADGRPLALIRFAPRHEEDYWRTAEFISPYLPTRRSYFDSRKSNYPDFFLPWERYVEAALAVRDDILAGRTPPPSELLAKPTPVAAPVRRQQEPRPDEEPMKVHEYQRLLREKREMDFDYWTGSDDRDR
jgi:hypothetical protein